MCSVFQPPLHQYFEMSRKKCQHGEPKFQEVTFTVRARAGEVLFLLRFKTSIKIGSLSQPVCCTSSNSSSPCFHFPDSEFYEYDDNDDEAVLVEDNDDSEITVAWQQELNSSAEMANSAGGAGRMPACPYCGKELRNMGRHIEDVHCPVEVACRLCGKICTSRNKLRTHMALVCNKRFNVNSQF